MSDLFEKLKPGTQIVYVPNHANGDVDHPDSQAGFVTSTKPHLSLVFCRYWNKYDKKAFGDGFPIVYERRRLLEKRLRTTANSEAAYPHNIVIYDTVPQKLVDITLTGILEEQEAFLRVNDV